MLPVIYITRTWLNNIPINAYKLSKKLLGIAHVLVETDHNISFKLTESCNEENPHHGQIVAYYPSSSAYPKMFKKTSYQLADDSELITRIEHSIIRYLNQQKSYTWEIIQNEILNLKNINLQEKHQKELNDNQDLTDLLGEQDEQIKELNQKVTALEQEISGLRYKLQEQSEFPIIFSGDETDLYEGEIKEIVLDILNKTNFPTNSRRQHIIDDILKTNNFTQEADKRKQKIKQILKGYTKPTRSLLNELKTFGFKISGDHKHPQIAYYGDERYMTSMENTGSDYKDGDNLAHEIMKRYL
jgi:hypothetical protein